MSRYDDIRDVAAKADIQISNQAVYRIASTLNYAYGRTAAPFDAILQEVLTVAEQALAADQAQGDVVVPLDDGAQITHSNIDTALSRGICPRCSKALQPVKLADYTPAKHCRECRITLW